MNGFSASSNRRAIVRAARIAGAGGSGMPSCSVVGNDVSRSGINVSSRGGVKYTGPRGSVNAICRPRLTIRPGLSAILEPFLPLHVVPDDSVLIGGLLKP